MTSSKRKLPFKKMKQYRNKIITFREKFLHKEIEKYKENYLIAFNREPKEVEIKRFRKERVMKIGVFLYATILFVIFVVWQFIIKGGIL